MCPEGGTSVGAKLVGMTFATRDIDCVVTGATRQLLPLISGEVFCSVTTCGITSVGVDPMRLEKSVNVHAYNIFV